MMQGLLGHLVILGWLENQTRWGRINERDWHIENGRQWEIRMNNILRINGNDGGTFESYFKNEEKFADLK